MMEDKRQEISVEELLKPRYKHIAPYPISHCYLTVGDILTYDGESYKGGKASMAKETVESYPHLFRKLEWWEDRKPEDMPKYVKYEGKVNAVCRIVWDEGTIIQKSYDGNGLFHLDNQYELKGFSWSEVEPATEAEYNTQKSNNGR